MQFAEQDMHSITIIATLVLYNESNYTICVVITFINKTRVAIIGMDYIPGCREQINFNS